MAVTSDYVREAFRGLETGDGGAFFAHVDDGIDWAPTRLPVIIAPSAPSRTRPSSNWARCFRRELSCA
jgi:hypothetical protein